MKLTNNHTALLEMMIKATGDHPAFALKSLNAPEIHKEKEVIKIVADWRGIEAEKIQHPNCVWGHYMFSDCLPIDGWGGDKGTEHSLELKYCSDTLDRIDRLGVPGLFVQSRKLDWLNKAFVYCGIPHNLIIYYDSLMTIATVDYRDVIQKGQYGLMQETKGFYLKLDQWAIIH